MQDAEIIASVLKQLQDSSYTDLRNIRCSLEMVDGKPEKHLVFRGIVRSYFMKQMAQALVDDTLLILNLIEVVKNPVTTS